MTSPLEFVTMPALATESVFCETTIPGDSVVPGTASFEDTIGATAVLVAADGLGMTFPSESVVAGTSGAKAEFVDASGFGTRLIVGDETGGRRVSPIIDVGGGRRVSPIIEVGEGRRVSPMIDVGGSRAPPMIDVAGGRRVSPMSDVG